MEPKSHQVIPRGWPLYTGSTVQRGTIEIDCQWRLDDKNVAKVLQPLKVTNDEQTLILILIGWLSFPCHITMTTFPTSLFLALFSALEVRLMVATPKEHVIIPLTAEVEYLRMLSFHQMAAPILTRMRISLTVPVKVQTFCGSLYTNLVTHWESITQMWEMLSCIPITLDMFQIWNYKRMTSTPFSSFTVRSTLNSKSVLCASLVTKRQ